MSGKPIAVKAKPTVAMPMLAIEKLRSRKSPSGISGSLWLRACHQMNTAMTTRPAMIRRHTVIGPVMVDQSYWWPSCSPKTSRNRPSPLSATPSQSKRWLCVSSLGTSRTARTIATMPTGTLMKKIHSQPSESTSRPPAIGPTRVATPAVAPHNDIAVPRRSIGKMRVMTAIVCGVIMLAPSPWKTRAMISPSIVDVSPHHRDAAVKTASPIR